MAASESTPQPTAENIVPTDRKDPYWDKSNPKHAEAVSAMSKRFSQRFPEATPPVEPSATPQPPDPLDTSVQPDLPSAAEAHKHLWEDADIGELQRLAGVNVSLPSGIEWHPDHGANFLSWVIAEKVPAQVGTRLAEWFADFQVIGSGEETPETEAEFRNTFAGDLTKDQMDLLVRFYRSEIKGGR